MSEWKRHFRYLLTVFLLSLLVIPLAAQVPIICIAVHPVAAVIAVLLLVAVLAAMCGSWAKRSDLPDSRFWRYLPVAAAFAWYMLLYVVVFGIAGYQFGSNAFSGLVLLSLPWLALNFGLSFSGDYTLFPIAVAAVYGLTWLVYAVCVRIQRRRGTGLRRAGVMLACMVVLCGVCGFQFYARSQRVIGGDYSVLKVEDEVDLWDYEPFRPGNLLKRPAASPSLVIDGDYPRLDGATAAFPVYGAMVQAVYKGLDAETASEYVQCNKTNEGYDRLIAGEADIFFGAQPSQQQIAQAAERGIEFHMTPIAKEAFVFFVSRENPVDGLTVAQIQDIYQKKTVNWRDVGGADEEILPFQRPQNSGSQTIMQRVMGDKALPEPLIEEYAAGMGGVINGVAAYRNYTGAIGYSFRYFATGMKPNEDIKLLSVEGVAPTVDNIRSETYPFTVDVYAVTTVEPQGNVRLLLDWVLSDEGQSLIEQCGYVGVTTPAGTDGAIQ